MSYKNYKRIFKESENSENEVIEYRVSPDIHFKQNYFDEGVFQSQFCDSLLVGAFNSEYNRIEDRIKEAIEEDNVDLAEYIDDYYKDIYGKVNHIYLDYDTKEYELVITVELAQGVSGTEVNDKIWEYVSGQLSDGWGEVFEQQPMTKDEIYASYNEDDEYDVEFFTSRRNANEDARYKEESYDEDDEEGVHYDVIPVVVETYVSFWRRDMKKPDYTYINGYNEEGYNIKGYDKTGYDKQGYNEKGFNKEGYDRSGYDEAGFDKEGFDKNNKDREGFDRKGEKDLPDSRPENKTGKKQGALFTQTKDGKVRIRNTFDIGESRRTPKSRRLQEVVGSKKEFAIFKYVESRKVWVPVDEDGKYTDKTEVFKKKEDAQKSPIIDKLKKKGLEYKIERANWNGKD